MIHVLIIMEKRGKMEKNKFCRIIAFILAFIGILLIGNIVHEMVHFSDVINQNGTIDYVCFWKLPLVDNDKWYNRAMAEVRYTGNVESSELKAFLSGLSVMIILTIIFCYGFFDEPKKEEDENVQEN